MQMSTSSAARPQTRMLTTPAFPLTRQESARRERRKGYVQRQILRQGLCFRKLDLKRSRLSSAPSTTRDLAPHIKKYRALDSHDKHGEWHEDRSLSRMGDSSAPRLTHLTEHGEVQMVKLPPPHPPSSSNQSKYREGDETRRFKAATSRSATAQTTVVFSNPYAYRMIAHFLPMPAVSSTSAGPTYDATGPNEEIDRFESELHHVSERSSNGSKVSKEQGMKPMLDEGSKAVQQQVKRPHHAPNATRPSLPNIKSKGDVLAVARIAGIQAAKATSTLIPLCHNIPLAGANVDISVIAPDFAVCSDEGRNSDKRYSYGAVRVRASVHTHGQTGVEMEALVAATVAGMTIYDMCKAVDRGIQLADTRVVEKTGGRSGNWQLSEDGVLRRVDEQSDLGHASRHTKYFSNDGK